jgi:hypothetical protein
MTVSIPMPLAEQVARALARAERRRREAEKIELAQKRVEAGHYILRA